MPCRYLSFALLFALSTANVHAEVPTNRAVSEAAQAIVQRELATAGPGAAVLVAKGDQVIFRSAGGRADIELAVPLDPRNIFRIGSITKTLTATTILKMVATSQLALQDRLSKFLPEFPNGENISVASLLNHTAGISDAWDANPADAMSTADLVRAIGRQPPDFPPGTDWRYSNSGYILLGAIIEKVTGMPWHRAIRDLLLTPLAMNRTGYFRENELVPGRAEGYSVDETGATVRAPYISMSGPGAAGALSSTVDDLFRFARALVTERILPSDLYRQMTSAGTTASGQTVAYGYGVMLGMVRGEPVIEHNGGIDGFASQLTYFPKHDVTVVVLANSDAGLPNARSLAHRLGALAIGNPYPHFQETPPEGKTLAGLVGIYRIGPASIRTLSMHDGNLFVRRDQGPQRRLATAASDVLYFPGDQTDYFQVIRDAQQNVVALDFHVDAMQTAQREMRIDAVEGTTNP